MDNYKILNSFTNKIIKLLNELGYAWVPTTNDSEASLLKAHWIIAESSGDIAYSSTDSFYEQDSYKELTFAELSDLVVLKRNDVKDATHRDKWDESIYLTSDKVIYYWQGEWCKSTINKSNDYENYIANSLTPITQPQDPALISGAEALRALADGKDVQWATGDEFQDVTGQWEIREFSHPSFRFRLKPTTLTINAELPKPHKETQQNTEVYAVTYEFKTREERNAFADKLRGTNS